VEKNEKYFALAQRAIPLPAQLRVNGEHNLGTDG